MTFFTSRGAGSVRSCELIPSTFLDFWARFLIAAAGEQSETGEHDACQLVRISMCTLWMCRWLITRPQVDVWISEHISDLIWPAGYFWLCSASAPPPSGAPSTLIGYLLSQSTGRWGGCFIRSSCLRPAAWQSPGHQLSSNPDVSIPVTSADNEQLTDPSCVSGAQIKKQP